MALMREPEFRPLLEIPAAQETHVARCAAVELRRAMAGLVHHHAVEPQLRDVAHLSRETSGIRGGARHGVRYYLPESLSRRG